MPFAVVLAPLQCYDNQVCTKVVLASHNCAKFLPTIDGLVRLHWSARGSSSEHLQKISSRTSSAKEGIVRLISLNGTLCNIDEIPEVTLCMPMKHNQRDKNRMSIME